MDKRLSGTWRIEEMEVWGGSDLDLLGPANITFDDDGLGSFQFVAVVGLIDCQFSERRNPPTPSVQTTYIVATVPHTAPVLPT